MSTSGDVTRDALAMISAMARKDEPGCDAILREADLKPLAAALAGMVVGTLEMAGHNPAEYVASVQRAMFERIATNG